jgi:hypothetical protein
MILESLRRVFAKSIDDESYCVIDESPKLFAACSFEHGELRSAPQECCPVASFQRENGMRGEAVSCWSKVFQKVCIAGLTLDLARYWDRAEGQTI